MDNNNTVNNDINTVDNNINTVDNIDNDIDIIDNQQFYEVELIKHKLNKTCTWLTKYEKAKILGLRATQIEQNYRPLVNTTLTDPLLIAEEELKYGKIPFIIKRNLPNNEYELVQINELIII